MKLKQVTFDNFEEAIDIQRKIFPKEDGTLNILASLDILLFEKKTSMNYIHDNIKYYIAYNDKEEIVGITGLYNYDNDNAWLGWFGILKEKRNKNYGTQLLLKTMDLAKEKGFKYLRLYTDKKDNAKAVKLYEKMGFVGEKYNKEDLDYDCYIYSTSLNNEVLPLWNNQFLNLKAQSYLDQMSKKQIQKILEMYGR